LRFIEASGFGLGQSGLVYVFIDQYRRLIEVVSISPCQVLIMSSVRNRQTK